MKKTLKHTFILGLLACTACSDPVEKTSAGDLKTGYPEIKKAGWLIGQWRGASPEGVFGEQWRVQNDSTYLGKGYFVVGKDTVSSEVLRLIQNGSRLFYEPTVSNQNNGKAVRFGITSLTDSTLVFENPEHDFPQKISYTKINNHSVIAEISGQVEGKQSAQVFPMTRVK